MTFSARGRRDARARLCSALLRALAVLVALSVVVGLARGNARFFYCASMGAIASTSCCAHADGAHDAPDEGAIDATAADCCRAGRIGALPAGAARGAAPDVPSAAWMDVLPPHVHATASVVGIATNAATLDVRHARRTGPPHGEVPRARTMVFLL